jgi:hypothetical protein
MCVFLNLSFAKKHDYFFLGWHMPLRNRKQEKLKVVIEFWVVFLDGTKCQKKFRFFFWTCFSNWKVCFCVRWYPQHLQIRINHIVFFFGVKKTIWFCFLKKGVSKFQIFSTYLGDLPIRAQIVQKMKKKDALPLMTT